MVVSATKLASEQMLGRFQREEEQEMEDLSFHMLLEESRLPSSQMVLGHHFEAGHFFPCHSFLNSFL